MKNIDDRINKIFKSSASASVLVEPETTKLSNPDNLYLDYWHPKAVANDLYVCECSICTGKVYAATGKRKYFRNPDKHVTALAAALNPVDNGQKQTSLDSHFDYKDRIEKDFTK
jgi:hypothetical protein